MLVNEDDALEMKPPVQYERPEVVAEVPEALRKMRLVVEALYPEREVKEEVALLMNPPVRVARPVCERVPAFEMVPALRVPIVAELARKSVVDASPET